MAENVKIVATGRDQLGTTAVGRLRRQGILPCNINTVDGKTQSIQVNLHDLEGILNHHGRENLLADVEIDGQAAKKALLRELQYEPISGKLLHADFLEVSMTRKMRVEVEIELVGECEGVAAGGVIDQSLRHVDIECLPTDIPESIQLHVDKMQIGDTLFVRDMEIDPKFTLVTGKDIAVVTVFMPREEEAAAPAEAGAEGAQGAEPELIGGKKEAEGEEGEEAGEAKAKGKGKGKESEE